MTTNNRPPNFASRTDRQAYEKGASAARLGLSPKDNPYNPSTQSAAYAQRCGRRWLEGYQAAQSEARESVGRMI